MSKLLSYEILENSYFVTKESYLRKHAKYELVNEIEKYLSQPSAKNIRQKENDSKEVTVSDFMAYARNIQLKLFEEFAKHLLDIVLSISWLSQRVDIIFNVYGEDSIKAFERNRRTSGMKPIKIEIIQDSTPIPVDMSSFWGSSSNKTKFQQFFIKWLPLHSLFKVPIYLRGAHEGNLNTCIKCEPCQDSATVESLYCEH